MNNGNHNGNGHNPNGLVHLNGNGHRPESSIVTEHGPAPGAGEVLLWDGLAPATTRALAQPLDPSLVRQRRGRAGMVYHYLEGHSVIDQANRIFGHGGWGYGLVGDVTLRRMESVDPRTGEVKASFGYSAPVRVTVAGAQPRTDIGFHTVVDDTPDGHDTAIKGAVTDGMKRALRSFGGQFGNASLRGLRSRWPAVSSRSGCLSRLRKSRGRTESAGAVQTSSRKPAESNGDSQAQMLRKRLMELGTAQGFNEEQVREAVSARTGRDLDRLTAGELAPLVKAAAKQAQPDAADPGFPVSQTIQVPESRGAVSFGGLPLFLFPEIREEEKSKR